jgi:hypothetical protein
LSQVLASREWKGIQERFRDRRIVAPSGIAFAGSQYVFAGYSGEPFSKNIRITVRCIQVGNEQTRQAAEALSRALE